MRGFVREKLRPLRCEDNSMPPMAPVPVSMSHDPSTHPRPTGRWSPWTRLGYIGQRSSAFHHDGRDGKQEHREAHLNGSREGGARRSVRSCRSRFGARSERGSCGDGCEVSESVNGCAAHSSPSGGGVSGIVRAVSV